MVFSSLYITSLIINETKHGSYLDVIMHDCNDCNPKDLYPECLVLQFQCNEAYIRLTESGRFTKYQQNPTLCNIDLIFTC